MLLQDITKKHCRLASVNITYLKALVKPGAIYANREVDMDEGIYLLWLTRLDGLGPVKQKALLGAFGNGGGVYGASPEQLRCVPGISEHNLSVLTKNRDLDETAAFAKSLDEKGIRVVTICDSFYPDLLREIHDPPVLLYLLGSLPDEGMPKVSLIGARRCTDYGLRAARDLSRSLAANGVVVVSGMASGIDSMAHKGAIEGGGLTVAVLGCGVDVCYPSENRDLRRQILENGCLISEYPPEEKPLPGYFPARNRIISGLSRITVVTEAAKRSGTLITVGQALDQGREVMAVPGNINSRQSEGTNSMIKDGAGVVTEADDILRALGIERKARRTDKPNRSANLAHNEKIVYDLVGPAPVYLDEIIEKSNSQAQTINYILMMLELRGLIRKLPGQRYVRE